MNFQTPVIPKNWKPKNPRSITKWMENLPPVYDLAKAMEIEVDFENKLKQFKKADPFYL